MLFAQDRLAAVLLFTWTLAINSVKEALMLILMLRGKQWALGRLDDKEEGSKEVSGIADTLLQLNSTTAISRYRKILDQSKILSCPDRKRFPASPGDEVTAAAAWAFYGHTFYCDLRLDIQTRGQTSQPLRTEGQAPLSPAPHLVSQTAGARIGPLKRRREELAATHAMDSLRNLRVTHPHLYGDVDAFWDRLSLEALTQPWKALLHKMLTLQDDLRSVQDASLRHAPPTSYSPAWRLLSGRSFARLFRLVSRGAEERSRSPLQGSQQLGIYNWVAPGPLSSAFPSAKSLAEWKEVHVGMYPKVTTSHISVPVMGSRPYKALLERMRAGASSSPPSDDSGRFALFPSWPWVTGTSCVLPKDPCDAKVEVSLECLLEKEGLSGDKKKVLRKLLVCRAPKLSRILEVADKGPRNIVVYLPLQPTVCRKKALSILSLALTRFSSYETFSTKKYRANTDTPKYAVQPQPKLLFVLNESDDAENAVALEAFYRLSNENTYNILILPRNFWHGTDVRGANYIIILMPFSQGKESQVIGRADRSYGQNLYHVGNKHAPQLGVLHLEYASPPASMGKKATRLACDEVSAAAWKDADRAAELLQDYTLPLLSYGADAMDFLSTHGLSWFPSKQSIYKRGHELMKRGGG